MSQSPTFSKTASDSSQIEATVQGEISGQVAVGNYILQIGSVQGSVVNFAPEQTLPLQARPRPVMLLPRPFPQLIGRQDQVNKTLWAIAQTDGATVPVEFYGASGIGKSVLLRYLAHQPQFTHCFTDGIVSLSSQHRPIADLLQALFEAFYDSNLAYKASDTQIRHALKDKHALVLLDGGELQRQDIEVLLNALPAFTFLLASQERRLWGEGHPISLSGLELADALLLVERELGRSLTAQERPEAEAICTTLAGNPGKILEALALVNPSRSLAVIAAQLQSETPHQALLRQILSSLLEPQRWVIAVLAALGSVALQADKVAALTGLADAEMILEGLANLHWVHRQGDRYYLSSTLAEGLPQVWDLSQWREQILTYFIQWAEHQPAAHLLAEVDTLLEVWQWTVKTHRWAEGLQLAKVLSGALALARRWAVWSQLLQWSLQAAERLTDQAAIAWVLHEQGTQALCLKDPTTAIAALGRALQIRQSLGEMTAAAVTRHNLNLLLLPLPNPSHSWRWVGIPAVGLIIGAAFWLFRFSPAPLLQPPASPDPPLVTPTAAPSLSPSPLPSPTPSPLPSPTLSPKPSPVVPVRILKFQAEAARITLGEATRLCYQVADAKGLVISPKIGAVDPFTSNCIAVTPAQTTRYTLTAIGADNQRDRATSTVTVVPRPVDPEPVPVAKILQFGAEPSQITVGGKTLLCYGVQNADTAAISPDIGIIEPVSQNCRSISPQQTTTYTLTVTGRNGQSIQEQTTVTVLPAKPPAPEILKLKIYPSKVVAGSSVRLCYQIAHARVAMIDQGIGKVKPTQDCFAIQPSQTTTYTLMAIGEDQQQKTSQQVSVTVQPKYPLPSKDSVPNVPNSPTTNPQTSTGPI